MKVIQYYLLCLLIFFCLNIIMSEITEDSCGNISIGEYLESIGRNPDDQYFMTIDEKASIPFEKIFGGAIILNASCLNFIEQLPHCHLIFYHVNYDINSDIVWRCGYCTFWSDILDQSIMENHLCLKCNLISEYEKLKLKLWVTENLLERIQKYV